MDPDTTEQQAKLMEESNTDDADIKDMARDMRNDARAERQEEQKEEAEEEAAENEKLNEERYGNES